MSTETKLVVADGNAVKNCKRGNAIQRSRGNKLEDKIPHEIKIAKTKGDETKEIPNRTRRKRRTCISTV